MSVKSELEQAPGIGPSIAADLHNLGIFSLATLAKCDPQVLYDRHCKQRGMRVDRCVLYVFRCGVYYASHEQHEPELLKWWNWKDSS